MVIFILKIGVRLHDLGKGTPSVLNEEVKKIGFDGVQLVLKKALEYDDAFKYINDINNGFKGIDIPLLGAYFNPVHPDKGELEEGIKYFKKNLDLASKIGADFVGTETGSLMGKPWKYVPENHHTETMEKLITVFKDLVGYSIKVNANIAIEGAYAHVAFSPKQLKHLVDSLDSPNVKVIIDLFNYLNIDNYHNRNQILEECFKYLKSDIVIYHLKDFIVQEGKLKQVGLGDGLMDFDYIIKRIKSETPDAYLVFEGVKKQDMISSIKHINTFISK